MLLAVMFIGMASYTNTLSANSSPVQNSSNANTVTSWVQMLNSTINNTIEIDKLNENKAKGEWRVENVNVKYTETSCTVTLHAQVDELGVEGYINVSATAATCDEAWAMVMAKMEAKLKKLKKMF